MASVAILIGAAIVNAVAFTVSNAVYDKFGRTDGSVEQVRHNVATEQLESAREEWNQKRLDTLDFINQKLREKRDARNTFDDVDKALEFYNETHPDKQLQLDKQPILEDFYRPSNEQKYYESVIVMIMSGAVGYIAYTYFMR